MLAFKDLEGNGVAFDTTYIRTPYFLKGTQSDIDEWYSSMGLPNDAPLWQVVEAFYDEDAPFNAKFAEAGLSPRNMEGIQTKVWTETMTAHRLGQYAASESPEKSELLWTALSRRFFMGKDTDIRPIRLDNHELLMECAEYAGLDLNAAQQVLDTNLYEEDVLTAVELCRSAEFISIPKLVFEVQSSVDESWLTNPNTRFRKTIHGSGDREHLSNVLLGLHQAAHQHRGSLQ